MKVLKAKSILTNIIRDFFLKRKYLEVDTPILSPYLIPEACLEVFKTDYILEDKSKKNCYLIPSPEIWMKKLLAKGSGDIFQITKSFRNTEPASGIHNPEFTMLEWYTVNKSYTDSIKIMQELLNRIINEFKLPEQVQKILDNPFKIISMKELFLSILNIDLEDLDNTEQIKKIAKSFDLILDSDDTWESAFNKMFLNFIEPELCKNQPVIIYDYPSKIPCLAKSNGFYCERWELYINGIEIANCYSEETDKTRVKDFFLNQAELKQKSFVNHTVDHNFLEIYDGSFPECSGTALGMDRLFMVLLGIDSLDGVITFPFKKIF